MQVRIVISSVLAFLALASTGAAETCVKDGGLGVSRIVEIDATGGPLYGDFSHRDKEPSFLGPKEVVLTFDDGPLPAVTRSILDTLDHFCTKATFFAVGRMAIAYPSTVREVLARGHTVGAHTWSHPLNLPRLKPEKAHDEIERGFAAVALAAGQPIAPFFRFTGLADPTRCSRICRRAASRASPSTSSPTTATSAIPDAWRRSRYKGSRRDRAASCCSTTSRSRPRRRCR